MAKARLVDSVIAETYSDVLRLHEQLQEITAAAPALLLSLKASCDEAKRTTRDASVEVMALAKATTEVIRRNNSQAVAELDRLAKQTAQTQAAHVEATHAQIASLKRHVMALTALVAATTVLNVACLAFWLSP